MSVSVALSSVSSSVSPEEDPLLSSLGGMFGYLGPAGEEVEGNLTGHMQAFSESPCFYFNFYSALYYVWCL